MEALSLRGTIGSDNGVYICAVSATVGAPVSLEHVDDVIAAGVAAHLYEEGLEFTRVATEGASGLALASLATTLTVSPARHEPDVVVYSTSTRWEDTANVVSRAGLSTVPVVGVTRNACANLGPALRVARSLLATEEDVRTAAVTLVDDADNRPRLMADEIGVLSDGAASCLVTRERPSTGWAITGLETAAECRLEDDGGADVMASPDIALSMGRQINMALKRLTASTDVAMSEYDLVLTNNYTWSTLTAFAQVIGFPIERLYDANRSSISHCFGADPLIDLASIERESPSPGTRVIALVCGPGVWSLLSLERL